MHLRLSIRIAALAGAALLAVACTGAASPTPPAASSSPAASPSAAASPSPASSTAGGAYGGGKGDYASPTPSAAPSSAPSASAGGGTGEAYTVAVAQDASAGAYLTGEDGRALYLFGSDTAGSGTSTCTGQCADNWPAFELEAGETVTGGSGVTGTFATITRDDGSMQVTYNGLPLYYFAGDTKAGDTNGKAIPNWSLATP